MYVNRNHHQNHKYPRPTHVEFWNFRCVDASLDKHNTSDNNTGGVQARQIPPNYCFLEQLSTKYLWVGSISSGTHATNHGASERWANTGRPPNSHKYHHFNLVESTQTRYDIYQPTCPKIMLFKTIQSTKHCANGVDKATAATAAQTQDPEHSHEFEHPKLNSQISVQHPYEHATHRKRRCGVWY
jgi:hypothetical protein